MKWVNATAVGLFLLATACSEETVPSVHTVQAAYERNDFVEARELARRALKADPENHALILLNGKIAVETDNPEYAIGALQPLTGDAALGNEAKAWLAKAYIMTGNSLQALRTLGAGPPKDGLSASLGVIAHIQQGDVDQANDLFQSAMLAFPNSIDVLTLAADNALGAGDVAQARTIAAKMLTLAPARVDVQMVAARLAMIDRDFDQALGHFDRVLKARPDQGAALVAKATILYDQGDRSAAEQLFRKAASKSGEAALVAQYFRARMAFDKGDDATAREIIQTLVDPAAFSPAQRLAGILASRAGQHEQAIRWLTGYLDKGGEDPQSRYSLALSLMKVGQGEAAWKALQPAAQSAAADAKVLTLAAKLTSTLGLAEALQYQSRLAQTGKPDANAASLRAGEAALRRGDWASADAIYTALVRTPPANANRIALNNAAYVRQQRGDLATAEVLIRRALAIDPNDPVLLDTASWIFFERYGATAEVVSMSRRARAALPQDPDVAKHAQAINAATQGL